MINLYVSQAEADDNRIRQETGCALSQANRSLLLFQSSTTAGFSLHAYLCFCGVYSPETWDGDQYICVYKDVAVTYSSIQKSQLSIQRCCRMAKSASLTPEVSKCGSIFLAVYTTAPRAWID